ncbi:hypothetical protein EWP17_06700, partial [Neisseria meningitidis]|nr:hypothetical protein [Neisseria meningitidis]
MLFYFFREYTKIPSFPRSRESERVRTETYIPSFPRKRESGSFGFACFKFRVTSTSSFPRRRESAFVRFAFNFGLTVQLR